jgi:heat shock transcription factor
MQAQARSRKRGADANATDASYTTYPQQTTTTTTTTTAQDGGYGANDLLNPYRDDGLNNFGDIAAFDNTVYYPPPSVPQAPTGQAAGFGPSAAAPPSNQLVRRSTNHQVARTPQRNQWNNFSNSAERVWEDMEHEEEQDLDQKAAIAKKDAQAKRKQIPPFVQKLSR